MTLHCSDYVSASDPEPTSPLFLAFAAVVLLGAATLGQSLAGRSAQANDILSGNRAGFVRVAGAVVGEFVEKHSATGAIGRSSRTK